MIFAGVFNVKRLQPGQLRDVASVNSFGHPVEAVTHDSSTLGGNSGSAVVDVKTGEVVGLDFAGVYLERNYAVPAHELALDRRVVEAGVNFDAQIANTGVPWESFWDRADPEAPAGAIATATVDRALAGSLPIEITIQIRSAGAPGRRRSSSHFTRRISRTERATTTDSSACGCRCRRSSTGRSSRSSTAGRTGCPTSTSRW